MVEKKRLVAYKVSISDIASGKFVPKEGLMPNYVITRDGRRLGRVRIIAAVADKFVSNDKQFSSLTLGDSTESAIRAKAFKSLILDKTNVGSTIEIIGKIKSYQDETYIIPEHVWPADADRKKLRELEIKQAQRDWDKKRKVILSYRKQISDSEELKHLSKEIGITEEEVEGILEALTFAEEGTEKDAATKQQVLDLISSLDSGEGCDYAELIQRSGIQESTLDTVVQEILEDGECFEPRPGKIRRIEK